MIYCRYTSKTIYRQFTKAFKQYALSVPVLVGDLEMFLKMSALLTEEGQCHSGIEQQQDGQDLLRIICK